MSWKKHFRVVSTNAIATGDTSPETGGAGTTSKYSSYLPEVYAGHPNRIQRYYQYDDMDRDSDINAALDTIADFCTQSEEQNENPFFINYTDQANETEVKLLKSALDRWVKINDFRSRLWYMFRNTIKNGDAFFLRDPETAEWLWLDHYSVEMVKVDDEGGKEPDEYIVRGLDLNRAAKFATKKADPNIYRTPMGTNVVQGARPLGLGGGGGMFQLPGSNRDPRQLRPNQQQQASELFVLDAKQVVHLSLSVGMDINWPFGQSVLEPIFKTFKQKELLEDSIIIYRVQRAPERRVFKIDVGNMPPPRAKAHIEAIKNEIHQRRIPNRTGGGSSIMDAAYNPLCLDMATRVPLLDGRTLTIAELAEEYRAGRENWVYSCDPATGAIVPGNITWAGVTRKDAKVLRLVLDNGETITCTPDHKIPVLGKGFVEAKDLTPNDSLIAFHTRRQPLGSGKSLRERTYTQVFDHAQKEWVWAHRMVGEFFRALGKHQEFTFLPEHVGAPKAVIHHKDYDRYNNDPRNLTFMNKEDHVAYHVFMKKDYWDNLPEAESTRIKGKIAASLRRYHASLTEEQREQFRAFSSVRNRVWIADKRANDPESWAEWRALIGQRNAAFFHANPEAGQARTRKAVENGLDNYRNQTTVVTQRMMQILVDVVKECRPTKKEAAKRLTQHVEFMDEFRRANAPQPGHANKIDYVSVPPQRLELMVERAGYRGWRDFTRKVAQYNHRIVRIEDAGTMDVGTITVDGNERWHAHHTFAVEAGIFVKNSIMEDFFFATTSEGRGSSVETLPGGDNLGEIGDLTFFTRKMARGLRIPASYLSLGNEESTMPYSDGRVGTALIQEFRFNKYCMRLQTLLAPVFDREFKRFLRDKGIEIENSLFELQFNPPQNFAKYRQIELDSQQVGVYQQVADNRKLSERFKLKRFLNLSEEELIENEKLWAEENAAKIKRATGSTPADTNAGETDLSAVGLRPGDDFGGMSMPPMEPEGDLGAMPPEGGDLGGGAPMGGAPAPGGAPAAPAAPPPAA